MLWFADIVGFDNSVNEVIVLLSSLSLSRLVLWPPTGPIPRAAVSLLDFVGNMVPWLYTVFERMWVPQRLSRSSLSFCSLSLPKALLHVAYVKIALRSSVRSAVELVPPISRLPHSVLQASFTFFFPSEALSLMWQSLVSNGFSFIFFFSSLDALSM